MLLVCKCKNCGHRTIAVFNKMRSKPNHPVECVNCCEHSFLSRPIWFFVNAIIWLIAPVLFLITVTFVSFYIAIVLWFVELYLLYVVAFYLAPLKSIKND